MIELNNIYNEDCLEGMKRIPDGSVDMILCDLPYGTVKNMRLDGWIEGSTYWDSVIDICVLFENYNRILKENGAVILFSQEPFTSSLRKQKHNNVVFSYPLIWLKDHFANPFNAKRAPVSYFEDISVFRKKYDTQNLNPLRRYFRDILDYVGFKSSMQINKALGHQRADHTFRVGSTQFKLCTEETYSEMVQTFKLESMVGYKPYSELERMIVSFNPTFNIPDGNKHYSNVLDFKKDYTGLHPTQKPVALFEHLIRTYTNENETILDNCMGSGTTAIACINTNRNYIGFELDENYHAVANERIVKHLLERGD